MKIDQKNNSYYNASHYSIGIAKANFNKEITDTLLKSCLDELAKYHIPQSQITVIEAPGSVEVPYALKQLAKTKKFHALVALGAIIKGETAHFDYVAKLACDGIVRVSHDHDIPIGFGIITAYSPKQAQERLTLGAESCRAVLELLKNVSYALKK